MKNKNSKTRIYHRLKAYFAGGAACFFTWLSVACQNSSNQPNKSRIEEIEAAYYKYKASSFPKVEDVSVEELLKLQKEVDVLLVDVRSQKEQEISMIEGAISKEQFEAEKEKYRDRTVVTYCTIGARAGRYARELMEENWAVYNLRGSLLSWANHQQGLVNQNGKTAEISLAARQRYLLPDNYNGVR